MTDGPVERWTNDAETPIPEGVGSPFGYRVLIMPITPPRKIGNIHLPDVVTDAQDWLNYVGRIAALGMAAFRHPKYEQLGMFKFPKVGDVVCYARHAPYRLTFKGVKFVIINDDEIIHLPESAEGWKVYVG